MRRIALFASIVALAACFDEPTPPRGIQIGGTEYNMNLSIPAPIRLPAGSGVVSSRVVTGVTIIDSIVVTATGLKELVAPARYQFWIVNGLTGSAWPIQHTLRVIRTDTTFTGGAVSPTSFFHVLTTRADTTPRAVGPFFTGAKFNTTLRLRVANTGGADTIGATGGFLVLTIQADSNAPAYTKATPKMLWWRFRNQTTNAVVAAPAGTFGSLRNISDSTRYAAQGSGRSAFWDRDRDGVLHLSAIAVGLPQPPLGYYYQPYARDSRTGAGSRFDGLRHKATLASLRDADTLLAQGTLVQLPDARFGARDDSLTCTFGLCADTRFTAFTEVQLVLEPKLGDLSYPNLTVSLQGPIPTLLTTRRAPNGFVSVIVTQATGGAPVFGATAVLYGAGTGAVLFSRSTDAAGKAFFTNVPSGPVDLRVFSASGATASALQRLQVVARDTTDATVQLP